ncbi:hypothetical protein [Kocuria sabuli]
MFASPAFYEPTEEHMEGAMAVNHLGAPNEQKSGHSAYAHLPDNKPVCAQ